MHEEISYTACEFRANAYRVLFHLCCDGGRTPAQVRRFDRRVWLNSAVNATVTEGISGARSADPIVLWSVTPEQTSSPYIRDLARALSSFGWSVESMTLRRLCTSTGQLVHIQWPEHVSRGPTALETAAKHARSVLLLAAIRLRGHRVVLTAHNRAPHGASDAADSVFRRAIQRLAAAMIVLVPGHEATLRQDGAIGPGTRVVTIEHPTHPPIEPLTLAPQDERQLLVMLGQIHPYHKVLEFVRALDAGGNARPVLIAGGVGDADLLTELESFAAPRPWLTVRPGFIDDADLVPILASAAAMVSLQHNTFNSGAPFYALPRGLPIVLNAGAQADDLRESVGDEWVFSVPSSVEQIDVGALEDWLARPRTTPNLDRFDVVEIARKHIGLYELLRS